MPAEIARPRTKLFSRPRCPRKGITKVLWVVLILLIVNTVFITMQQSGIEEHFYIKETSHASSHTVARDEDVALPNKQASKESGVEEHLFIKEPSHESLHTVTHEEEEVALQRRLASKESRVEEPSHESSHTAAHEEEEPLHSITQEEHAAMLIKQALQFQERRKRPRVVKLTVYYVCPTGCNARTRSDISTEMGSTEIKNIEIDAKSVRLDSPPIPIIGTDEEHLRVVSSWDVAEFMAHVSMWRGVFHGDGGVGIFLSCRVKEPLAVLKALRKDKWFRNESEGGTMGKDGWDIVLLGAGREAGVPTGSVQSRVVAQTEIREEDLVGYAVSQKGADRLLSYVRAYTVGIKEFMSVVVEKNVEMVRWDGAGLGQVERCEADKGETRSSTTLPFYAPVDWMHVAVRKKRLMGIL